MINLGRTRRWSGRAGAIDRCAAALEKRGASKLAAAVAAAEVVAPLPRCNHGKALVDGAGEALEPSCGCRVADIAQPAKKAAKKKKGGAK